jgi:hypothetical protein
MKTALTGWLPPADPEALIKEARRRQRRRRIAIGLALVVLAGAAVGITAGLSGPGGHSPERRSLSPAPSSGAFAASAWPAFFADAVVTGEGNGPLEVRTSASGRLVAQTMVAVSALAAAGPGRFVIASQVGDGCATRLYRVQVSDQGRLGALSQVGPELRGLVWSLAASAGGQMIGYAVSGCIKGDPGYIAIFDTRTGFTRQWGDVNAGGISPGNVALDGELSISANGRLLAFTGWNVAGNGRNISQFARVLPTDAPAGTVAERSRIVLRRPVSEHQLAAASLSPDGASFYLCTQSGRVSNVASYRTSTGTLQQNLAGLGRSLLGCSMALDPSGRFLLVPGSLTSGSRPMLKVAEIDVATRAVTILTIQLARGGGMDPPTGMIAAW